MADLSFSTYLLMTFPYLYRIHVRLYRNAESFRGSILHRCGFVRTMMASVMLVMVIPAAIEAQIVINNSMMHEHESSVGDRYRGAIMVRNTARTPQTLRIKLADYRFAAGKPSEYLSAKTLPRSNAGWITLDAPEVTIPANQAMTIGYTVVVPDSLKSATGTYWSVLILEGEPAKAPTPQRGLAMNTRLRHVIQVATHLGTSATRKVEFTDARVEDSMFRINIVNKGQRAVRPVLRIEAYDVTGTPIGNWSIKSMAGLVYPETSVMREVVLGKLKPGQYTVVVVADIGGDEVQAARFKIRY